MIEVLRIFGIMMAVFLPIAMLAFIPQYFSYKRSTNAQIIKLQNEMEANSTEDLEKEIAELKERIIVLESIVTDRGFEVERKISSL